MLRTVGCVHAADPGAGRVDATDPAAGYLTPFDLNRDLDKYDGKAVEVAGWINYGFERRFLIAIDAKGNSTKDRARKGDCTSIEVPHRLDPRATALTRKNVIVRGTFHADLLGENLNFGFCTVSGIRVESVDPLVPVAGAVKEDTDYDLVPGVGDRYRYLSPSLAAIDNAPSSSPARPLCAFAALRETISRASARPEAGRMVSHEAAKPPGTSPPLCALRASE